jgi:hypothetical protein
MHTTRKIALSAAIILSTVMILTGAPAVSTDAAFADAPGGAYIQCDGGPSSPVRCVPDGW